MDEISRSWMLMTKFWRVIPWGKSYLLGLLIAPFAPTALAFSQILQCVERVKK